jgi:hypothetical protein
MPDSSIPGTPPEDKPFRDRVGGQPPIRLGGRLPSDLVREERDQLAERGQFLRQQLDTVTAERDRLSDRVEELTGQLRQVTEQRDAAQGRERMATMALAEELAEVRAKRDKLAARLAHALTANEGWAQTLERVARQYAILKGGLQRIALGAGVTSQAQAFVIADKALTDASNLAEPGTGTDPAREILPPPRAVVTAAYLADGSGGPKVILEVCPCCTAHATLAERDYFCRAQCTWAGCRWDDPANLNAIARKADAARLGGGR